VKALRAPDVRQAVEQGAVTLSPQMLYQWQFKDREGEWRPANSNMWTPHLLPHTSSSGTEVRPVEKPFPQTVGSLDVPCPDGMGKPKHHRSVIAGKWWECPTCNGTGTVTALGLVEEQWRCQVNPGIWEDWQNEPLSPNEELLPHELRQALLAIAYGVGVLPVLDGDAEDDPDLLGVIYIYDTPGQGRSVWMTSAVVHDDAFEITDQRWTESLKPGDTVLSFEPIDVVWLDKPMTEINLPPDQLIELEIP